MTAPALCAVCEEQPATVTCPTFAAGRLCASCHVAKRLAFACPCMTAHEAIEARERESDPDAAIDDVHVDHITPWSKGGATTLENLRVTHSRCNLSRGNREVTQ